MAGVKDYLNERITNAREASLWKRIKDIKETFSQ
jgi:hypothetical protein